MNILVDLDGNDALVTYPIINQSDNQVLAVLQVAVILKLVKSLKNQKIMKCLFLK